LGLHAVYFGLVIHRDPHRSVPHWLMEDGAFNSLNSMQSLYGAVGEAFGF
jgi:hypothetical protein